MNPSKPALRAALVRRRGALDAAEVAAWSEALAKVVLGDARWRGAQTVSSFVGVRGEPDTRAILAATLAAGKTLLLPRVRDGGRIDMARVRSLDELVPAGFGLLEPPAAAPAYAGRIDLVLVPGLAFAGDGARIGFGAGYYDRWLAGLAAPRPSLLGLAFAGFVDPPEGPIAVEAHDVFVDAVATELGIVVARAR